MIKFKPIFIIIGFILSYSFHGQEISEETAQLVAKNFLTLKSENNKSREVQLTNVTNQINKKYDGFYIFKINNGKGFCIISSEMGNHPILAYSFDSPLSTNGSASPGFLRILDGYQAACENLRKNKFKKVINEGNSLIKKEWEALLSGKPLPSPINAKSSQPESVKPLIQTTWAETKYYNKFTPIINGKTTATGDVATALAQIMKYWNYPVTGKGTHTYTIPDTNGKTLTADFQNTTYQWGNMPNSLSSASTEAEVDAVATLMLHVGIAVDMKYQYYGSMGNHDAIVSALKNYFKYSPDVQMKSRPAYYEDNTEWKNSIKDQLAKGYPVFVYGAQVRGGGHSFVIDGYDSNNLYHHNYGYGGTDNGYYSLDDLEQYNDQQIAIFNIYPPASTCSTLTGLSASNISENSVLLKWNAASGAQNYTVEYKTASATTWTTANTSINSTSFTLSGLAANTAYSWRVKANCSGSSTSNYTLAYFNTISTQGPCIANFEPNDSFESAKSVNTDETVYFAGFSSSTDKDYYKFTIDNLSDVSIYFENMSKTHRIYIYDSSLKEITSDISRRDDPNLTLYKINPGTYYLYVDGANLDYNFTQCYNFKIKATTLEYNSCTDNFEPNDSFATATAINNNASFLAKIGSPTDKDYYKFTLNALSNFDVGLEGYPTGYTIKVYDSAQNYINESSAPYYWVSLMNQKPGTYYLVVEASQYSDLTKCYNLVLHSEELLPPCDPYKYEPNDSFETATEIKRVTDYHSGITSATDKDYYKFTLNKRAKVTVHLDDLPKDYNLIVYNSSKKQIGSGTNSGTTNESVALPDLEAGTYYIYVYGNNGNFDNTQCYTISFDELAEFSCIPKDEPNDSFATATWVYTNYEQTAGINNKYIQTAGIGSATDKDYYKFKLDENSDILITLSSPENINFIVYNNSQAQIGSGTIFNDNKTAKFNNLEHGTYYVVVYGENGYYDITKCYSLKIDRPASCNANYEPNDTFESATPIEINTTYSAGYGYLNDKDYYKFTLNKTSSVKISLDNINNSNISVYNSSKEYISSYDCRKLEPGTYYVLIANFSDFDISKCYDLTIKVKEEASCIDNYEPNNFFDSATAIKTNTDYYGAISYDGDFDYYKFTLNSKSNVSVSLQSSIDNHDFKVYDASKNQIGSGNSVIQLNNLSPGTYYVYIKRAGFDITECYKLNVQVETPCIDNNEPNDSFASATAINTNIIYSARIESATDKDYYKFTLNSKSNATVTLQNITTSCNINVYDSSQKLIGQSTSNGIDDISIPLNTLEPGTYYLFVESKDTYAMNQCYKLQVKAYDKDIPCIANSYEPNDSFKTATAIDNNTRYAGSIDSATDKDYYKFTLNKRSKVFIHIDGDCGYNLYNSFQEKIEGYSFYNVKLEPGTYYLYLYTIDFKKPVCYNLKVEAKEEASCSTNYEPNDSFESAVAINTNTNYSAAIDSNTDKDYYKFTLSNKSNVTVSLQNPITLDYSRNDFKVFNSSKEQKGATSFFNSEKMITLNNLEPGTYYVQIYAAPDYFDFTECYNLKVNETIVKSSCIDNFEPNDSFSTAKDIDTNTNYSAGIGSYGDKDYYKFSITRNSKVTVNLQNLPKDYDLKVYSGSTLIGLSNNSGFSNESVHFESLEPDTYYVVVEGNYNFDVTQCYNLLIETTEASPCVANYEPNDYFTSATPIHTNTNYSAAIGSATDKDYYKFTIDTKSNITISLQNLPKDYNLMVYNASQVQIVSSTNSGTSNESVTLNNLVPGTYYVVVYGENGNFDIIHCYNLYVEATVIASCITNYEPNDSFAQASTIQTNTNYSAGIGSAIDKDYYKFTLDSKSNVTVTLQDLPKDYNLIVYNASKVQIGSGINSGTSNESVSLNNLEPGSYYVVVYGNSGYYDINQCYNLRVEATESKSTCVNNYEPNDSFAQATAINTNTNYYAGIGSATDKDYFKFSLNSISNVTVTLQDLPNDYNFEIYDVSNKRIGKGNKKKNSNKSVFSKNLDQGTYYVVVYGNKHCFDIKQCYNLIVEANTTTIKNANASDPKLNNGILNSENNTSVILYPNPVEDIINIKGIYSGKKEHTTLTIYDRNGRIVKFFPIRVEGIISINVSDLSPNMYYLSIKGKNYKFIKK
ncbi:pre-peptidase C-terminal domain-containing protein [Apibacter adventoris]|uniref:Fibronectin type-III domain-containing protein n=1 Tax=Apibacter adventoris TaxID=1679466 RepID=A0A2S8AEY2_9FLAO|nr:pre-peptidase C-terminal domain-containing protein [Apibacter adventoris]PQL93971.1 hypothetical protein C4S77_04085 [Apibacter adventoris]